VSDQMVGAVGRRVQMRRCQRRQMRGARSVRAARRSRRGLRDGRRCDSFACTSCWREKASPSGTRRCVDLRVANSAVGSRYRRCGPADPPARQEAQIDFGLTGTLTDAHGKQRRLWVLIVTLSARR